MLMKTDLISGFNSLDFNVEDFRNSDLKDFAKWGSGPIANKPRPSWDSNPCTDETQAFYAGWVSPVELRCQAEQCSGISPKDQ